MFHISLLFLSFYSVFDNNDFNVFKIVYLSYTHKLHRITTTPCMTPPRKRLIIFLPLEAVGGPCLSKFTSSVSVGGAFSYYSELLATCCVIVSNSSFFSVLFLAL